MCSCLVGSVAVRRRFNSGFASRDYRQQHQHRPTGAAVVPPMPNPMVFNPAQPPQAAAPQQASFLYSGGGYGSFYQQQPAVAGWWSGS